MKVVTFKKIQNIIGIISALLIIALVAGLIFYFARHTNNFTEDYTSMYLELNGEGIFTDRDISIELNKEYSFKVKGQNLFKEKDSSYTVKVVPNITDDTKFSYYVEFESYTYNNKLDFTDYFIADVNANGFILKAEKDLPEIMNEIYPNKYVSGVPLVAGSDYSYFTLIVSSRNAEMKFNLYILGGTGVVPVLG